MSEPRTAEKADLIRDIRARLPLVAVGHPDLAAAIASAMDRVEGDDRDREDWLAYALNHADELRPLFDPTATELRVGALVRLTYDERTRLGVVVQMGDADDHPDRVLVYQAGNEYPAWWATFVAVPLGLVR